MFYHKANGTVQIGRVVLSLEEFKRFEPDYQIDPTVQSLKYEDGTKHIVYRNGQSAVVEGDWAEGNRYMQKEATFANYLRYRDEIESIERNLL